VSPTQTPRPSGSTRSPRRFKTQPAPKSSVGPPLSAASKPPTARTSPFHWRVTRQSESLPKKGMGQHSVWPKTFRPQVRNLPSIGSSKLASLPTSHGTQATGIGRKRPPWVTLPSLVTQPKEVTKMPGEPTTLLISYPSFSISTYATPPSPKSSRGYGIMPAHAKSERSSGWPSTRACQWAPGSKQWVSKLTAKATTSASRNPPSTASWTVFLLNGLGRPSTTSGKNGRRLTASPSLGPSSS